MLLNEIVSPAEEAEVDLAAIVRAAWKHKLLVTIVTVIAGLIAVAVSLLATPIYRADVVVTDVREAGLGAAVSSSMLGQLGGLAGIAGFNLGGTANKTQVNQAVLKSRNLVEEFIERNGLIDVLFEDSDDDATLWLAVQAFQGGVLRISEDTRQAKTTITIDWKDPEIAARWANGFVALANELIRERALDEATRNVAYLTDQIQKTHVVELQRVMYNLIENETKALMLANARIEYAFQVVDPATAPERRISPNRRFIVLSGTAAGFFISLVLAFALDWWKRRRAASALR
jgi:uncharacterized protein involved in exopolysaccharide biosynthesis